MVAGILTPFMTLGLETAMNKFYFDFVKYPKIERAFISTLVISIASFTLLLSILFLIIGPHLFAISFKSHRFTFFPFGFTALLTAMPAGIYSLYLSYLRCKKDLKNYVILNLGLFVLASLGEIIGIVFLKMRVENFVWIKPIITWAFVSAATIGILRITGLRFDKRLLRLSLRYSTPLLPHLIFSLVFVYTDRLMIENNLNLTYLAIYNLTMAISSIIDIFEQALRNATFPNIYKLLKENVYENVDAVSRIHTLNGLILMIIVSGVTIGTPIGAYYILKPVYSPLIYLIPFALIISVIRFYYIVYGEPLFFFKKVQHISTATFLQGSFAIAFNFYLIPKFGLIGAITANILSKVIQVIYIYFMSMRIKIFSYRVGFILTSMLALILILIGITFISRPMIDYRLLIHVLAAVPFIFTGFICLSFIRRERISLRQNLGALPVIGAYFKAEPEVFGKKRNIATWAFGIGLIVIAVFIVSKISYSMHDEHTDNAQVQCNIAQVTSNIPGYIQEIRIGENRQVHKGDTLLQIDSRDLKLSLQKAESGLKIAFANLQKAQSAELTSRTYSEGTGKDLHTAQVSIDAAQVKLWQLQGEYDRNKKLLEIGSCTYQQFDKAKAARDLALKQMELALKNIESLEARVYTAAATVDVNTKNSKLAQMQVAQMQQERDLAKLNLSHAVAVAPCDGYISKIGIHTGDRVSEGQYLCAIVNQSDIWIAANFKQTQIEHIKVGQKVKVKIDAYPGVEFIGAIESLSGAVDSQLTQKSSGNSMKSFGKVTEQRPVRIRLDRDQHQEYPLRAGMSATVTVRIR